MTGNYPPGTGPNDPNAPWNQDPPDIEERAVRVELDVIITVPEHAEYDREREAIDDVIRNGEYDVLDYDTVDVLDRRPA